MKKNRLFTLVFFCCVAVSDIFAQQKKEWLEEILQYENNSTINNDSAFINKTIYVNYIVKATNWENETTISHVKLYQHNKKMHFFSEQANLYRDEQEALIILPSQKVLMINSVEEQLPVKSADEFAEMRKGFLGSCQLVRSEVNPDGTKVIALKVNTKATEEQELNITEMVYTLDTKAKRIISTSVLYDEDYKLKELTTLYKEFNLASQYTFAPVRSFMVDKKGNLLPQFKNYELIDNREAKKKKSR